MATVIKVASKISRTASGISKVASSGLLRGINASRAIASLSKIKLSWFCKATVIISLILIRAKLISLSVHL